MSIPIDYTVRTLDQEIDAVEICPELPDFVVVGTYSLMSHKAVSAKTTVEAESEGVEENSPTRIGSLQILPIVADHTTANTNRHETTFLRQDFPCAVLDIRFCPSDGTLLGASTSIGEIRFFRVAGLASNDDPRSGPAYFVHIGTINLSGEAGDESEPTVPLVTQFGWAGSKDRSDNASSLAQKPTHYLVACDTLGRTKLVEVSIPLLTEGNPPRKETGVHLSCKISTVHKHLYDLEAWAVSILDIPSSEATLQQILLSGGDDSCLILSRYTLNLQNTDTDESQAPGEIEYETPPARVRVDKQTHGAGVVSILPLPGASTSSLKGRSAATRAILTGSYDQRVRLLLLDINTCQLVVATELELDGGVWRIALLNTHLTRGDGGTTRTSHVLLISAMHAGCYVVRLNNVVYAGDEPERWDWHVETHFREPHESMVYACTARKMHQTGTGHQVWDIISTSFYDKRVCVWQWIDTGHSYVDEVVPEHE